MGIVVKFCMLNRRHFDNMLVIELKRLSGIYGAPCAKHSLPRRKTSLEELKSCNEFGIILILNSKIDRLVGITEI